MEYKLDQGISMERLGLSMYQDCSKIEEQHYCTVLLTPYAREEERARLIQSEGT